MKHEWIVIANAARARVLELGPSRPLVMLRTLEHPASRARSSELGDDRAGRELSGHGFGGAAFEPRVDAQSKERQHFARELAQWLEDAAHAHSYDAVHLFASSPFLGELKHALGPAASRLVAGTHDVDLTAVGLAELGDRIEQTLAGHRHDA